MLNKIAKMKNFGRHSGGSKKDAKKDVSRYARRVLARREIAESRNA